MFHVYFVDVWKWNWLYVLVEDIFGFLETIRIFPPLSIPFSWTWCPQVDWYKCGLFLCFYGTKIASELPGLSLKSDLGWPCTISVGSTWYDSFILLIWSICLRPRLAFNYISFDYMLYFTYGYWGKAAYTGHRLAFYYISLEYIAWCLFFCWVAFTWCTFLPL